MKKGFTLIEVLIATVVLTGAILAILSTLIQCSNLQETSKNLGLAINAARGEIEEMRNADFTTLIVNYNGPFEVTGLNGKGCVDASYVAGSNNNLVGVRIAICWRQKGGRIIGEDNGAGGGTALDGILHANEDADGDGEIDSPCVVDTSIANKD